MTDEEVDGWAQPFDEVLNGHQYDKWLEADSRACGGRTWTRSVVLLPG